MTTNSNAGSSPVDRRVGDQSYVTEDGPVVTGYDMGSPDGDYYCEMHYDNETGVFTVLNFGRVLIPNAEFRRGEALACNDGLERVDNGDRT